MEGIRQDPVSSDSKTIEGESALRTTLMLLQSSSPNNVLISYWSMHSSALWKSERMFQNRLLTEQEVWRLPSADAADRNGQRDRAGSDGSTIDAISVQGLIVGARTVFQMSRCKAQEARERSQFKRRFKSMFRLSLQPEPEAVWASDRTQSDRWGDKASSALSGQQPWKCITSSRGYHGQSRRGSRRSGNLG
jgi:hypothetical protein